jgi:hypothetical protein
VQPDEESTYIFDPIDSVASLTNSPTAQSLAAELQNPAAPGERHTQIKRAIMPMLEIGLRDAAIFAQFRAMYDADVSDSEIDAVIAWGRAKLGKCGHSEPRSASVKNPKYTDEQKIRNATDWLGSFRIDPVDLWEKSQLRDDNEPETIVYLRLFSAQDLVNINARYLIRKLKDGTEKAELCGPGYIQLQPGNGSIVFITKVRPKAEPGFGSGSIRCAQSVATPKAARIPMLMSHVTAGC